MLFPYTKFLIAKKSSHKLGKYLKVEQRLLYHGMEGGSFEDAHDCPGQNLMEGSTLIGHTLSRQSGFLFAHSRSFHHVQRKWFSSCALVWAIYQRTKLVTADVAIAKY